MTEAPFTHGLGTVLAAEYELLAAVHERIKTNDAGVPEPALRILRHHVEQIEAVIDLLELREGMFPFPNRFVDWDGTLPQTNRVRRAAAGSPMSDLAQQHQELRESLDRLIQATAQSGESESGLREAAQRHEEMEWMLTALLKERAGDAPAILRQGEAAQDAWQNEGGQGQSPSIAQGAADSMSRSP